VLELLKESSMWRKMIRVHADEGGGRVRSCCWGEATIAGVLWAVGETKEWRRWGVQNKGKVVVLGQGGLLGAGGPGEPRRGESGR